MSCLRLTLSNSTHKEQVETGRLIGSSCAPELSVLVRVICGEWTDLSV